MYVYFGRLGFYSDRISDKKEETKIGQATVENYFFSCFDNRFGAITGGYSRSIPLRNSNGSNDVIGVCQERISHIFLSFGDTDHYCGIVL